MLTRLLILQSVVLPAAATVASTINVPGDISTIQVALHVAQDGDEIVVAPGTYASFEDNVVDMLGKAITLRSSDGPHVTFIDGQNASRGIICQGGEGPGTVIEGFTIRNGHAPWYDWNDNGQADYWEYFGGGLWNRGGSSPTVINCRFIDGWAEYGAGICNFDEDSSSNSPSIIDCVFQGNSVGPGVGGAIYSNASSPSLSGCTFTGNIASYGGGMLNVDGSNPSVTSCDFSGNLATSDGGGIYNDSSMPTITDTSFSGNIASDEGGAVFNADPSSIQNNPVFVNCSFSGNIASNEGGAMHNFSVNPVIDSCSFSNNSAGDGGGIYSWNGATPGISGSGFCENAPTHIEGNWADAGGNLFTDSCGGCIADLDGSGHVGVDDLLVIIGAWASDDPVADLDGSGHVGVDDLLIVIQSWGPCP